MVGPKAALMIVSSAPVMSVVPADCEQSESVELTAPVGFVGHTDVARRSGHAYA
jgi:hypothetical protein